MPANTENTEGLPLVEDADIVREILQGKEEKFALILERYQRPIFNFVYRFFGDYTLAEDLAQESVV